MTQWGRFFLGHYDPIGTVLLGSRKEKGEKGMNEFLKQILTLPNILIYLALVNAVGFLAMGLDKLFAKAKMWRISEKALITLTCIGGGVGTTIGMLLFKHKTTKKGFKPTFITVTILEAMAIIYYIVKYT